MCKECGLHFCGHNCPNYTGYLPGVGQRLRICSSCGSGIYGGEFYYLISGDAYCEDCVRYFDLSELSKAFGYPDISYLIEELGGKHRRD